MSPLGHTHLHLSSLNPLLAPLRAPAQAVADRVHTWSVESQQVARRNAMVANTTLAARRRDRDDVDSWFAALAANDLPDSDRRAAARLRG